MDGFPDGLAGYAPVELIGCGGKELVFKARRGTGQFVVVKTPHYGAGPAAHARFERCARLRGPLSHPHIAALIDVGRAGDGRPYAVSEFVPGETLRRFLQRTGPLEIGPAGALMGQLLDALACLHAAGVVHRDLKPQNVMVTATGVRPNIKLIDFDIAASSLGLQVGETAGPGTPGYCAPEQRRGAAPAPAADLYAWGLLFLECLSCRPALPRLSTDDPIRRAGLGPLPAALRGHGLEALLRDVLSDDPRQRGDAGALHARLQGCLDGAPTLGPRRGLQPVAAPSATAPVACISLTLTPLAGAGIDLDLLEILQGEQRRWCQAAMLDLGAELVGAVGDRMLFRFGAAEADDPLRRAALGMTVMWAEADRRKRLLAIRHGLELRLKAGLDMAGPHAAPRAFDDTTTAALRLNDHAAPGLILTSPAARRRVRQAKARAHPPAPADHA